MEYTYFSRYFCHCVLNNDRANKVVWLWDAFNNFGKLIISNPLVGWVVYYISNFPISDWRCPLWATIQNFRCHKTPVPPPRVPYLHHEVVGVWQVSSGPKTKQWLNCRSSNNQIIRADGKECPSITSSGHPSLGQKQWTPIHRICNKITTRSRKYFNMKFFISSCRYFLQYLLLLVLIVRIALQWARFL